MKKATLIDQKSILLVKLIKIHLLQSNSIIVDQPSKPTSRVFSFTSTISEER